MTQDLLLILTIKNNAMLSAMKAMGYDSAAALARDSKVSSRLVYEYLNLKLAPVRQDGEWRGCITAIAQTLRRLPEDLFPPAFLNRALASNRIMREVDAADLPALVGGATPSLAYDPERSVAVDDALEALDTALGKLPARDRLALNLFYGLDGKRAHTLDEIGRTLNVSRERIRQILLRAQRRLAWPGDRLRERCAALLEDAPARLPQ